MKVFFCLFILLILFSLMKTSVVFAQENFSQREDAIISSLDQFQGKEMAFLDAFMEAEMSLIVKIPRQQQEKKGRLWDSLVHGAHFYISNSLTFNDNIYATKEKTSAIVNEINPGVKIEFLGKNQNISLEGSLGAVIYSKQSQDNHLNLDFRLSGTRNMGFNTLLFLHNRNTIEYLSASEFGSAEKELVQVWHRYFHVDLNRQFNRLGLRIGFRNLINNFESKYSLRDDSKEYNFNFTEFLKIAPKTRLLLEQDFGFIRYEYNPSPSRDSEYRGLNFGITGLLTKKLTGTVKIGFRNQDYETGDDFNEATLSGDLAYALSNRTNLAFNFERFTHEATYRDEDYYINNSFSLDGAHKFAFNPRFHLNFDLEFSYRDYPRIAGTPRKDKIFGLGLGVGYEFQKWLTLDLSYSSESRKSNVDYNYDTNIFALTTRASF